MNHSVEIERDALWETDSEYETFKEAAVVAFEHRRDGLNARVRTPEQRENAERSRRVVCHVCEREGHVGCTWRPQTPMQLATNVLAYYASAGNEVSPLLRSLVERACESAAHDALFVARKLGES